ncbi:MAG: hypothetical protein B6241_12710 [Spirochaetaceae bacterium 4572_59]|nr:MAG: hypothetical protein B6241_12710 [Spirochaetaceae bacterium 4572_59]
MSKKMDSIYEIAKIAKVSSATVSRVINGKEGVGDDTRKKILQILNDRNFKPSSDYSYNIMLISLDRLPKDEEGFRIYCNQRGISAGIFLNLSEEDIYILNYSNIIPIATVGTKLENSPFYSIKSENEQGGYDATKFLIDMGHENIAIMISKLNVQDHKERYEGYIRAHKEAGLTVKKELIFDYTSFTDNDVTFGLENLFDDSSVIPTAAFIVDDYEVLRLSSIFRTTNVSIPEDLSIIGFDDYYFAQHLNPPLTTVRQPLFELGHQAALAVLNEAIGGDFPIDHNIVLPTRLISRKSVKTPKK